MSETKIEGYRMTLNKLFDNLALIDVTFTLINIFDGSEVYFDN